MSSAGTLRRWFDLTRDAAIPDKDSPLLIIQHPSVAPLKLAMDTEAIIGSAGLSPSSRQPRSARAHRDREGVVVSDHRDYFFLFSGASRSSIFKIVGGLERTRTYDLRLRKTPTQ